MFFETQDLKTPEMSVAHVHGLENGGVSTDAYRYIYILVFAKSYKV